MIKINCELLVWFNIRFLSFVVQLWLWVFGVGGMQIRYWYELGELMFLVPFIFGGGFF